MLRKSNAQPKPKPEPKHGRCRICGHALGRDGECFFFPSHSQERPALMLVDNTTKPKAESETVSDIAQLSLSEELFDRYAVETVKISLSGAMEVPLDMLVELTAGLEPGDTVAFTCRGHVVDVSTPYRLKDHGHEGRLVLRAEVLHGVQVLGVVE